MNNVSRVFISLLILASNTTSHKSQTPHKPQAIGLANRVLQLTQDARGVEQSLSGVYRFDPGSSDKLYSVIASAAASLPNAEQQSLFDDLAARLSSPDQLAIEQRGRTIHIASSRAGRVTIEADGRTHTEQTSDNQAVRTRAALEGNRLTISTSGTGADDFSATFERLATDRLRVTRRITTPGINEPIIVRSIYNKISDDVQWSLYERSRANTDERVNERAATVNVPGVRAEANARDESRVGSEGNQAALLRSELQSWIAATNNNDIEKQMSFYLPRVDAFYRTRNVSQSLIRAEKQRAFKGASAIDITADEPEIIFDEAGRTAIMRFRKGYRIDGRAGTRRGQVIQELRWRRTNDGWKIASERDVRV